MNLFDDPDGRFVVLMNEEEQHSLWPASLRVPQGWTVVHHEDSRESALAYIEQHWPDIRPLSVRKHLAESASLLERADA